MRPMRFSRPYKMSSCRHAALKLDLKALRNPASSHIPGEFDAYLELKLSLLTFLDELQQLEAHLGHLLKIASG